MRYVFLTLLFFIATSAHASTCTFTDWEWHSASQKVVNFREVKTDRTALSPDQVHPILPCSICREDQVHIKVGEASTSVCHAIADDVQTALTQAVERGFKIDTLIGYRVGKTKGPLNHAGLRTQYSHHSFGLALDINPERNGLYNRCVVFSDDCRLGRGGHWHPGREGTITKKSPIYHALTDIGLKWGGELQGSQKDFMHFSLEGD